MRAVAGLAPSALSLAVLLVALSVVTWRQTRALDSAAALDEVQRDRVVAEAEIAELERRIRALESRSRVVADASDRLGMRSPSASEILYLPEVGRDAP